MQSSTGQPCSLPSPQSTISAPRSTMQTAGRAHGRSSAVERTVNRDGSHARFEPEKTLKNVQRREPASVRNHPLHPCLRNFGLLVPECFGAVPCRGLARTRRGQIRGPKRSSSGAQRVRRRFRDRASGRPGHSRGPVIGELGDMLSLDDGQLSTINGVLANGSHPRRPLTRSSPTGPGISDEKEHDHG
jgi:hypothetical protein